MSKEAESSFEQAILTASTTEERVDIIEELMSTGRWVTRTTERKLAAAWGVSRSRIRQLSAEASRRIRSTVSDDERLERLRMGLGYLDRIKAMALSGTGKKALVAGINAVKLEQQLLGNLVHRHDVEQSVKDQFSGWTTEELNHYSETGELPERFLPEELH